MIPFFEKFINFILPPRCINCGKILNDQDGLCEECFSQISFISRPFCEKCGQPFEAHSSDVKLCGACLKEKKPLFRLFRSVFLYDDFSKKMILSLKFMDKTENAKHLARMMNNAGEDIFSEGVDVIIPIPLHYNRMLKRRYNQSGLLAQHLAKICHVSIDYSSVIRCKNNRPQVEFSGKRRHQNIKGVFQVKRPEKIEEKRILLVDDVYTTGSTMKECAKELLKAGAKSVDFLTIARTSH
ncbi:MAG: ComF family protein [Alphaproteobacteria bacterium]|nr:ComF family protein [Alphaproteobacteria bacterium]